MTPLAALRARHSDGTFPETTDDELLAWSDSLLRDPAPPAPTPSTPTAAARVVDAAAGPRPRRTEPLRAERLRTPMSLPELFAEIEERASSAHRRR